MDTKKLRQKILDLAIHGKLVPQDPNDEPASVLLERIRAEKERLISEGKIKRSRKTVKTSDTHHYENVPFEIPKGWVWCTLEEISNYGDCNNISVTDIADDEWVLELEDLKKDTASIIQILSKAERNIKDVRHKFNKGDVLYSKLRTYLNKVLVAPQAGYCTTEIIPFNSYCNISTYYLCHVLRTTYFLDYTQQCGYGVKMPRLSTNDAHKGMIPLPPLCEQQRIVEEIEHWFSLIDTIEQGKEELQTTIKQAKSKILDLAIHGKLVPQDPSDEPASELLKRINPKTQITCDNEHYTQLPKGWSIISMQDICKLKDGIKQDNIPLINLDVKYLRGVSEGNTIRSGRFVSANSYMILVDGENSGEIFKAPIEGYQGSTFKQLDIDKNVYKKYILNVINLHRRALRENKVGSAIPHLNKKLFKAISVPLPPYNEQIRIVEAIKSIFNILDAIKESL